MIKYFISITVGIFFFLANPDISWSEDMLIFQGNLSDSVSRTVTFAAGGLILCESLLLSIGMNFPAPSEWSNLKNMSLAISDILLGGFIAYSALYQPEIEKSAWFYGAASVLMITHAYREYEFLSQLPLPFCANAPLSILNHVRLAGLSGSIGLALKIRFA